METLRLYATAPLTGRTLEKPFQFKDGLTIPAGANVMVPIWAVHRREANFPRALEFIPERWVQMNKSGVWEERASSNGSQTATAGTSPDDIPAGNRDCYVPFSSGGRNCPGQKFAYHEATLVLAGLLSQFTFKTKDGFVMESVRHGFVQHPATIPMTVTMRKKVA